MSTFQTLRINKTRQPTNLYSQLILLRLGLLGSTYIATLVHKSPDPDKHGTQLRVGNTRIRLQPRPTCGMLDHMCYTRSYTPTRRIHTSTQDTHFHTHDTESTRGIHDVKKVYKPSDIVSISLKDLYLKCYIAILYILFDCLTTSRLASLSSLFI
jgi:hypothetical protein